MPLPLVYHADYVTPLPPGHRFPMPKFGRVYAHLIGSGIAGLDQFHYPVAAPQEWLEWVHSREYVDAYRRGTLDVRAMRRIGFPWSPALVTRTCTAVGGTVQTAILALEHGLACNIAGGTHHAYAEFGSGFCIFNDLAVAARYVQHQDLAQRVLIVDLDVHQGDGTASIFQDDPSVFTFSMHCGANFPFRKAESDLDVDLEAGVGDEEYLARLTQCLPDLLDHFQPHLVLYDAGVDPHVADRLGKLALSDHGLHRRDGYVLESCIARGLPVACVIGGGYAENVDELAARHAILYQTASDVFQAHGL